MILLKVNAILFLAVATVVCQVLLNVLDDAKGDELKPGVIAAFKASIVLVWISAIIITVEVVFS